MSEEKKNNSELDQFNEYFADDLRDLQTEFEKSSNLFEGMKNAIDRLEKSDSRGAAHYLLTYYENIIELQNQKQNIIKNRISLKKIIMDYAKKNSSGSDSNELLGELQKQIDRLKNEAKIEAAKNPITVPDIDDSALDDEIDDIVNNMDED